MFTKASIFFGILLLFMAADVNARGYYVYTDSAFSQGMIPCGPCNMCGPVCVYSDYRYYRYPVRHRHRGSSEMQEYEWIDP